MSKMKHLLRKLHIGNDRLADHRPTPPPPPPLNPSSSASTSSLSSSLSLPSASPSPASASSSVSSSASRGNMSDPGAGGSRCDPSAFEEEYQVQLALALSASDPNGVEDLDSVQIKAAKRMSLASSATADVGGSSGSGSGGGGGGAGESLMELLSLRYWSNNVVNYEEKLRDGFYDVYGVISNSNSQGKMPTLVDLQAIPVSDNIDYEVVLVNRTVDRALQQLESRAVSIVMESRAAELGPIGSGLVQKIADLVVDSMGGPVSDAEDMLRRWTSKSFELRTSLNTIVLPLGLLEIGLSRHRALLFKVLADLVNLPCKLVKGSYYTGTDEGAVNLIKVDNDNEYIVDLMGAPGVLIPAEVPSTHLQNPGLNLPTLDTIDQTVKDLCLALDNVNSQFEKKSQVSEGSSSCGSSFSGSVGLPSEQRSRPGPPAAVDNQSNFEKITEKSGHEFGVVSPPMGRSRSNTSATAEVISPAQQMKVHDVSKYVVTAAKNPEFAQKLHAVLLESGASPPLDLFSDLNISQNLVEQKELGNTEVQKDGQFPKHGELESLNCAADTRNKKFLAVDNSDSKGRNYDMFTSPTNVMSRSPFGTSNESSVAQNSRDNGISYNHSLPKGTDLVIENAESTFASCQKQICLFSDLCESDSSKQQFVSTAKELGSKGLKANVGKIISSGGTEGNGFHRESQETAKDSSVQLIGKDENGHHDLRYLDNERIHSLLDGVAEWEIPWGDLQIGERIGLGSYGEVYHADWNGTEVAVKKFLEQGLSGDALEQFRCEVKIMLRLRHPNVVLFMGAVTRPPNLSILTEFLPRGSLYRLLHRPNVKLDEKRRLKMALDVAKGMNYLHTSHPTIVHRDLKSPNLLVDRNWVVKVADFGLSRLKHHTFLSSKSTAGTPEWMAPEVLRNEPSNEKCDIYSFGVILWELATMRMPWSGMNPMQVVGAVGFQNRRLDIPKEVDPMIAKIITECWDSEPNQRPSFAQIMSTLKQLQHLVVAPT